MDREREIHRKAFEQGAYYVIDWLNDLISYEYEEIDNFIDHDERDECFNLGRAYILDIVVDELDKFEKEI